MTASALRAAYLDGSDDPVAAIRACLRRCADDQLNALITIDEAGARRAADASFKRYRNGGSLGIWDGIPFVAKDNIAAAGLPWTAGIRAYRERVAENDAEVIAWLKAEGAILVGKANLHEAALGTSNDNPWFGKCQNPHKQGYTPGGSSGGSGAAVGGGLVPLALGTDTMGSVRVPAAYCGAYGYKPGPGVLSQDGVTPVCRAFDTIGLIAGSSDDLEIYGRSLARLEPRADVTPPIIGILEADALSTCAPACRSAYDLAVSCLQVAGLRLEPTAWFDDPSAKRRAGLAHCITEAYVEHEAALAAHLEEFSEELRGFLTFGRDFPSDKLSGSKATIERLRRDYVRRFSAFDLVLTPSTPYPAHSFDEAPPDDLADFTAPANLIGLPACSLPFGRSDDGIPLGLQLVGRKGGDGRLLDHTVLLDRILNPAMDLAKEERRPC